MQIKEQPYFNSPPTVRKSMLSLVAGWISLMAFIYHINAVFPGTVHVNNAIRVALVGLGIGYFVFRIKPWARTLCIFINLGAMGINALFVIIRVTSLGLNSSALTLHALATAVLFGICTYFLLAPATTAFYRAQLPAKKDKVGSEDQK